MVKPTGEPASTRSIQSSEATRSILQAAFRRLAQDGYARLSMREIAKEAGVNHALINYYYGSKDRLVIAVLDELNERLLARQERMYAAPDEGFAEKWERACRFYDDDLASGFVRVQMELWAASLSNEGLRREFVPRVMRWRKLIEKEVAEAIKHYQLKLPIPDEVIACWITDFWLGMEFEMLLGVEEKTAHHRAALEAVRALLQRLDQGGDAPRSGVTRRKRTRKKARHGDRS